VARQHFAGNLGVAGLVGANQTEIRKTKKEEKSAESGEQKPVGV
jgi:hypothetical protein